MSHARALTISTTLAILLTTASGCQLLEEAADAASPNQPTSNSGLTDAIEALTIADENRDGYDRDKFSGWITVDGCTTRQLVLIEEDVTGTAATDDCGGAIPGEWISIYDGQTVADPSDLDIDHYVPLAEAWDSGASDWSAEQRAEYAVYLDDDRHLVAVTAESNRSKSDQDPAEWMPEDTNVHCDYVATWVAIKTQWELTVDETEYDTLIEIAGACPADTAVEIRPIA